MQNISKLLNLNLPFILASNSPRRKKLLEQLGFEFTIIPSHIDEELSDEISPSEHVKILSLKKAQATASAITYPAIILASDTIVVLDNKILNKPNDKQDAILMLKTLSGRTHKVYSGIALYHSSSGKNITDVQVTDVTFRNLDETEIKSYVESGSPMDKAGAYGIQDDFGAVFVSHINGCYYNIVGLPLELLYSTLKKFIADLNLSD